PAAESLRAGAAAGVEDATAAGVDEAVPLSGPENVTGSSTPCALGLNPSQLKKYQKSRAPFGTERTGLSVSPSTNATSRTPSSASDPSGANPGRSAVHFVGTAPSTRLL